MRSLRLRVENFFYSKLSGNLLITYVNQLFPTPTLQHDTVKISF